MRRIVKIIDRFNKMMADLDDQVKNKTEYNKERLIYDDYLNDKNYQYIKRAYRIEKWVNYLIKGYKVDKERGIKWENRYA